MTKHRIKATDSVRSIYNKDGQKCFKEAENEPRAAPHQKVKIISVDMSHNM